MANRTYSAEAVRRCPNDHIRARGSIPQACSQQGNMLCARGMYRTAKRSVNENAEHGSKSRTAVQPPVASSTFDLVQPRKSRQPAMPAADGEASRSMLTIPTSENAWRAPPRHPRTAPFVKGTPVTSLPPGCRASVRARREPAAAPPAGAGASARPYDQCPSR